MPVSRQPESKAARRSVPSRRRRRTPEEARREILNATGALLREREFRELSVDSIMAATGMRRPSFYHYFEDLPDVLLRLLDETQIELLASADPWLTGSDEGPQALACAITRTAETWWQHREIMRTVHDAAALEPKIADRYRGVIDAWTAAVAERLAAEHRRGRTPVTRPHEIAFALNLMNANVFAERLGRGTESPARVSRILCEIWVSTIYPDHGNGGAATG